RSVHVTDAFKTAAQARPTNPVPAPSSRSLGLGWRRGARRWRIDASARDDAQVLWPRLLDVRDGSWRVMVTTLSTSSLSAVIDVDVPEELLDVGTAQSGISKLRVILGAAMRPHRSAILRPASSQICSW